MSDESTSERGLTMGDVKRRLAKIGRMKSEQRAARERAELMAELLKGIADGTVGSPRKCASLVVYGASAKDNAEAAATP